MTQRDKPGNPTYAVAAALSVGAFLGLTLLSPPAPSREPERALTAVDPPIVYRSTWCPPPSLWAEADRLDPEPGLIDVGPRSMAVEVPLAIRPAETPETPGWSGTEVGLAALGLVAYGLIAVGIGYAIGAWESRRVLRSFLGMGGGR